MAALGRWGAVDPLADQYAGHSPYNYVLGNPNSLVDPDGRQVAELAADNLVADTVTFVGPNEERQHYIDNYDAIKTQAEAATQSEDREVSAAGRLILTTMTAIEGGEIRVMIGPAPPGMRCTAHGGLACTTASDFLGEPAVRIGITRLSSVGKTDIGIRELLSHELGHANAQRMSLTRQTSNTYAVLLQRAFRTLNPSNCVGQVPMSHDAFASSGISLCR